MKKHKSWFGMIIIVVVIFGISLFLNSSDNNPAERWRSKHKESNEDNRVVHYFNLEIEILSCKIIEEDDQKGLEAYPVENYFHLEYPSESDKKIFVDYEKIAEESDAMKDLLEHPDRYTQDERDMIYQENRDIVEKNRYLRHPHTKYAFMECRITSTSAGRQDISPFIYRRFQDGKSIDYDSYTTVYFDKAMYRDLEERSFYNFYDFTPGEQLECTLGFALREDFYLGNDVTYYLGGYPNESNFDKLDDPKYDKNAVRIVEFGKE